MAWEIKTKTTTTRETIFSFPPSELSKKQKSACNPSQETRTHTSVRHRTSQWFAIHAVFNVEFQPGMSERYEKYSDAGSSTFLFHPVPNLLGKQETAHLNLVLARLLCFRCNMWNCMIQASRHTSTHTLKQTRTHTYTPEFSSWFNVQVCHWCCPDSFNIFQADKELMTLPVSAQMEAHTTITAGVIITCGYF